MKMVIKQKWVGNMVRKIKNNTDKIADALQNPKRSERKYKQALLQVLEENGFSYEDFVGEPEYLKSDYIDEKTMFVIGISTEIIHGTLKTFEKIIFPVFNTFLKSNGLFPENFQKRKINIVTPFNMSDVIFFEVMINSPNIEAFFERFERLLIENTNLITLLNEEFSVTDAREILHELFSENRELLIKENNFLFSGKENVEKLSQEEFESKYYSLSEGDYLISSLKEDIHIRFEGFNEDNNPMFSFIGENEIEVRDIMGPIISQKGTWIENDILYIEKEKIIKAFEKIKKKPEIIGYIEYHEKTVPYNVLCPSLKEKAFSFENFTFISSEYLNSKRGSESFATVFQPTKEKNLTLFENIVSILSKENDNIINNEIIESVWESPEIENTELFSVKFVPEVLGEKLDLSWYFSAENSIGLNSSDVDKFNIENNLIESVIFFTNKKKI